MIVPCLLEVDFGFRINKIGTILSNFFDLEMWRVETISVALLYIIINVAIVDDAETTVAVPLRRHFDVRWGP